MLSLQGFFHPKYVQGLDKSRLRANQGPNVILLPIFQASTPEIHSDEEDETNYVR